jgi:hypothetical protein
MVPATKEPIAAVASAARARPRRAIWGPSIAVATEADSPGVLSRIDVVDPPYMPPAWPGFSEPSSHAVSQTQIVVASA